ncbi:MAG: inositol monophosphatase family protein [Actinomycetes bacterium]
MAATKSDPALLDVAVAMLREAGELTLSWFRSPELEVQRKSDGTPVTAADREAERFLRDLIHKRFPHDAILGEEHDDVTGSSGRRWIIDPIDGTKAFTHGVPLYSNLLAIEDDEGPAIGVINMPALGETVYAGRGLGCFCNGIPAQVSNRDRIAGSYISTSDFTSWPEPMMAAVQQARAQLRTWGDGYGFALVATGRIDAMCDPVAALWDLAPMPIICAEAGGRFSDLTGKPGAGGGGGIATNGVIHDEWLERFGLANDQ